MNLNPISWIVDGVSNVVSSYQTSKQARVEAKTAVQEKKVEYEIAKWQAKTDLLKSQGKHDADYDMQVLKNRQFTWLDEVLGVSLILMTAAAFIPGLTPYVKDGWDAVSAAPFWFQFAWYVLIVSTLGGLTVLRILMGVKKKASLPSQNSNSTDPLSRQDTSHTLQQSPSRTPSGHREPTSHEGRTDPQAEEDPKQSPSQASEQESREQPASQHRPSRRPGPPHGGGR